MVKIDANGNKQWDQSYGTADGETLKSMVPTTDGGFLLVGQVGTSVWMVKIDAKGNRVWDKTLQSNAASYNYSLEDAVATADGGFLVGSTSNAPIGGDKSQVSKGNRDYWIVKVDASGNKRWDKTIGTSGPDYLSSLAATPDGGYLLGGVTSDWNDGDKTESSRGVGDYWLVKINEQGTIVWDKTVGGNLDDFLFKVIVTADQGILAAGSSYSPVSGEKTGVCYGNDDYWAVKLK